MNKEKAIKEIKKASESFYACDYIKTKVAESIISKIHEPQKVTVPKFVAEWIKWCKTNEATLLGGISPIDELGSAICNDKRVESMAASRWAQRNQETFARAWLDGYEVEQERLYQIFIKNTTNYKNQIQQLVKQGKKWFFCGNDVHRFKSKFTKGQIEAAGFGWVFDCKGVEVKEVE